MFTLFCFTSHIIYYRTYFNSYSTFPCTTVSSFLFFFQSSTFLILLLLFYSSPSFLMSIILYPPCYFSFLFIIAYFFLPSIFPSLIYSSSSSSSIIHCVFFSVFLFVFIPLAFSLMLRALSKSISSHTRWLKVVLITFRIPSAGFLHLSPPLCVYVTCVHVCAPVTFALLSGPTKCKAIWE